MEANKSNLKIGDYVALSAVFLRSMFGYHSKSEIHGYIVNIEDDWLASVAWNDWTYSKINLFNLVKLKDKTKEALDCEHKNIVQGIIIKG